MIENCQFLTFKVNFPRQKLSKSFSIFFSLKNINLGAHLVYRYFQVDTRLFKFTMASISYFSYTCHLKHLKSLKSSRTKLFEKILIRDLRLLFRPTSIIFSESIIGYHTTYSWNIKWQNCAGMGLNGFKLKKMNEN